LANEIDPRLRSALRNASCVVFLCSGNMVRSAFAELVARAHGVPLPVRSAGTVFRNDRLLPETAAAARARGVPEAWVRAFRPTHLDDVLATLDARSVVFGMTRTHLEALAARPELAQRAFLLSAVAGDAQEIADPVLENADWDRTFESVAAHVATLRELLCARD
jgi:protein-tyrosine-phosphatase